MIKRYLKRGFVPLLAISFGGYCVWRVFVRGESSALEAFPWLLFSTAMLVLVAIFVAFPIAENLGIWISRFYMPAADGIPPVSYVLAERYERELQWEKSLREYQKIIHYHPKELPAHLGRMRVIMRGFDDAKYAESCFRKSLQKFQEQESRDRLHQEWERLREKPQQA